VVRDAGLSPEYTPHVLRHTCASWNLWAGKSLWDVAKLIGATTHEVEKTYAHHRIELEVRRKA
jgi:site-specific recombinase XerD